jgi:hypothetical protein
MNKPIRSRDLEAIITLMEVAALALTSEPGATFTRKELMAQMHEIGGDDIELDDADIVIVLQQKPSFIERVPGALRLK